MYRRSTYREVVSLKFFCGELLWEVQSTKKHEEGNCSLMQAYIY